MPKMLCAGTKIPASKKQTALQIPGIFSLGPADAG